MQRVLVFGDTHIPTRKKSIPLKFYRHIEKTEYDMALVTGDIVRESDLLKVIPPLPRSYIVKGNMDYAYGRNFHETIQIDEFKFLLLHGTQLSPRGNIKQLNDILDNVGGDIAVHGHTHIAAIDRYQNKLFLNPGTLSGAAGISSGKTEASFLELEVENSQLTVILHRTDSDLPELSKLRFFKEDGQIVPG
ncbi:MAG: YfcE family phosphodiesterase [Candidatus Lokiarchaeota archaeon]|nr:YfcE family phosphodiesterase [Candidatus Lokiarchaeota archaeon]